ncbi:MAG TPA: hypothetical protein VFH37_03200 [Candidatus Saccharimonadales bacterium]|nr:hypothetical protein [Candidatus Saccharimonadales bacterium]
MISAAEKSEIVEPAGAEIDELESRRSQRRQRLLGNLAVNTAGEQLRSDDALAPIFALLEHQSFEAAEPQIKIEYTTDMAERAKKRHFNKQFDLEVSDDDIYYTQTGQSYREMMAGGLTAARIDANQDPRWNYAKAQAEIQAGHIDQLLEWYHSEDKNCVLISSLCPDELELPPETARVLNFKTDRAMSVNWLFEKTEEGMSMHAFSLDGLSLEKLTSLSDKLGVKETPASTALEQLARLTKLPFTNGLEAVEAIRRLHDGQLDKDSPGDSTHYFGTKKNFEAAMMDANSFVESRQQAYETYKRAVKGLANSLVSGKVCRELADLSDELKSGFTKSGAPAVLHLAEGLPISLQAGRDFMDYLRRQALPHYIYEGQNLQEAGREREVSVAYAGVAAVSSGSSYEGACPSASAAGLSAEQHANGELTAAMKVHGRKEFTSRYCPNCLPKPQANNKVRAWRQGEHIGCRDCGHVVDVCTGNVVRQGKKPNPKKSPGLFELLFG